MFQPVSENMIRLLAIEGVVRLCIEVLAFHVLDQWVRGRAEVGGIVIMVDGLCNRRSFRRRSGSRRGNRIHVHHRIRGRSVTVLVS